MLDLDVEYLKGRETELENEVSRLSCLLAVLIPITVALLVGCLIIVPLYFLR